MAVKQKISALRLIPPDARLVPDPVCLRTKEDFAPSSQRRSRIMGPSVHYSHVRPLVEPFPYAIDFTEEMQDKAGYIETWLSQREPSIRRGALLVPEKEPYKRVLLGSSPNALPSLDIDDEAVQVLGGAAMLADFEPYAARYSGHQFGVWAGQLGDGRAITVMCTDEGEVQLKGTGRTPYSRSADGLAVTRSSVREFLCSEYMAALGIPTTRALSIVGVPDVSVMRERVERACVIARVAPSFLRIGSIQTQTDVDGLRRVAEVSAELLGIDIKTPDWASQLVLECAARNARMVAGWQVWGFMHGVINTDNVSILGLTIDYGPFAFMDIYDPLHICNHSDDGGRYAYRSQPANVLYALQALLTSLSPLITSPPDVESHFNAIYEKEYDRLMALRLGIKHGTLGKELLAIMQDKALDFHTTFCRLANDADALVAEVGGEPLKEWVNPQFVLRQWVLEEVIKDVEEGRTEMLEKVLAMSQDPCRNWGACEELTEELVTATDMSSQDVVEEEKRLCSAFAISTIIEEHGLRAQHIQSPESLELPLHHLLPVLLQQTVRP
ncbi:UPF0061-domain-containing protein [Hymenopellis radicata]|nr:UPF0061-domain-containing protein [Hymenopellis radicata]